MDHRQVPRTPLARVLPGHSQSSIAVILCRNCMALQETKGWIVVVHRSAERLYKVLVLPSAKRREKK